jgi:hypothetical protein
LSCRKQQYSPSRCIYTVEQSTGALLESPSRSPPHLQLITSSSRRHQHSLVTAERQAGCTSHLPCRPPASPSQPLSSRPVPPHPQRPKSTRRREDQRRGSSRSRLGECRRRRGKRSCRLCEDRRAQMAVELFGQRWDVKRSACGAPEYVRFLPGLNNSLTSFPFAAEGRSRQTTSNPHFSSHPRLERLSSLPRSFSHRPHHVDGTPPHLQDRHHWDR